MAGATARVSRTEPPAPGNSPYSRCRSPILARSLTTDRSQASMISQPPATA